MGIQIVFKTVVLVAFALNCLIVLGHPVAAEANILALEKKLVSRPEDVTTREALAKKYLAKKNYNKVIELLAPYSNEVSGDSIANLAQAYGETQDKLGEIRTLQIYVQREGKRFRPHHMLGMALKRDKKFDEATTSLRKAIELAPGHRPSYEALLEIFIETKQNYESRTLLNDMVRQFGAKKEFAHTMCRLYAIDSFLKEALEACKSAVRLDSKFPDSHVYLAQTYYNQENSQAAERILKTAARQFPKSEFVQYAAGEFYLNEKNYPAAVRYLQVAVKINSSSLRGQLTLAQALFETRDHNRALVHFERACQLDKSKETVTLLKNSAARLRQNGLMSLSEQFDRKAAVCQQ